MFAEEGFDSVTMRAIAERIEYTPTAIYHHFKNKNALLSELCMSDFGALAQHFNTSVAAGPCSASSRSEKVSAVQAEEHLSQFRFMFMTVMPPPAGRGLRAEHRGNLRRMPTVPARGGREAIDQGIFAPGHGPGRAVPDPVGGVHMIFAARRRAMKGPLA
jgi:AcrR family transcriptional regulator